MKMPSLAIAGAAVAALMSTQVRAQAPVPTCQALSLYANAANTGLCRSLSPTTQNHWVCELGDNPDIHTTFNAANNLHITVRTLNPGGGVQCQGNSQFTGNFPGALALVNGAPICNVNIQNYAARLNAVPQLPAAPGQTRVQTAALAAVAAGRLTIQVAQTYINTAAAQGCP